MQKKYAKRQFLCGVLVLMTAGSNVFSRWWEKKAETILKH